jgi:flagellar protein FliL
MAAKAKKPDDEAAAEQAEATPAKTWSRLRLALVGVGALVLLAGGGGGSYYYFFTGKKDEKVTAPAPKPPTFFDLPDVLVNLAHGQNERTQYLKVKLVLELSDPAIVQQIQPVLPRVMDTFQVFLRELRPTDLEGSAGTYRLKEELTRRVNAAIAPSRINAVLFKEMLVQ